MLSQNTTRAVEDQRLVTAHEEAARIAFCELETFAAARVRKQGNQRDRITGNLVAAQFVHTSSRELDPLLHTHFLVPQKPCRQSASPSNLDGDALNEPS